VLAALAMGAAFVISYAGVRLLLARFADFALDQPNQRSLHERPVPRTGGIAVLAGAIVSLLFGAMGLWLPVLLAVALGVLSFVDDLHSLPTSWRLSAHIVAALIVVWYVLSPMYAFEIALLVLAVGWITNLYNFMDGSDGLAGGMSVIGFATYALAAGLDGDMPMLALCGAIAAASAAFLVHNFHPARIFLGDVGSIPLGFLAGALGVIGWRDDHWPLWFPVLVFGPFIGDATLTLARRVLRGERVWRAHREHYYQRLVRMGFGHRGTALVEYAAMLVCAAAALAGRNESPAMQATAFAGASIVLAAIAIWIDVRWLRYCREEASA
jgi:UDP-N-acetylmuramyl pentapeptide phosphotransferase/UDP-N-acetylglucosamine-1-phosphate transferase